MTKLKIYDISFRMLTEITNIVKTELDLDNIKYKNLIIKEEDALNIYRISIELNKHTISFSTAKLYLIGDDSVDLYVKEHARTIVNVIKKRYHKLFLEKDFKTAREACEFMFGQKTSPALIKMTASWFNNNQLNRVYLSVNSLMPKTLEIDHILYINREMQKYGLNYRDIYFNLINYDFNKIQSFLSKIYYKRIPFFMLDLIQEDHSAFFRESILTDDDIQRFPKNYRSVSECYIYAGKLHLRKLLNSVDFNVEEKHKNLLKIEDKIFNNYTIEIVKNSNQLIDTSIAMKNCLQGYWRYCKEGETVIVLLKQGKKARYAIQLEKINQINYYVHDVRDVENVPRKNLINEFQQFLNKKVFGWSAILKQLFKRS